MLCFLDDILIFSRTEEEHLQHLRAVLTRLREQELYVKLSKCAFMQREVAFLGHRIGADGLRVAPDKIGAVQQWPQPKNVSDVRSFLGLANFYRRFVQGLQPHRAAADGADARTTAAWQWGAEQQAAFEALKAALCSPPVLLVPDQSKPFVLNCDACKYAIGATLQQDHGSGDRRQECRVYILLVSNAFASRRLYCAEIKRASEGSAVRVERSPTNGSRPRARPCALDSPFARVY